MAQIGQAVHIEQLEGLSQPQMWQMLASGGLDLIWGGRTTARDQQYRRIDNRVTNGLSCMRVLMVKKGREDEYASVQSIDDLRALGKLGGCGEGWFERELWQANNLPLYVQFGNWNQLFQMLADNAPDVDFITRSVNEAVVDIRNYPDLCIVPRLLIVHDRDIRFYLSPAASHLQARLDEALQAAEQSGLKKRLVSDYLMPHLVDLNLAGRLRLRLPSPPA